MKCIIIYTCRLHKPHSLPRVPEAGEILPLALLLVGAACLVRLLDWPPCGELQGERGKKTSKHITAM